MRGDFTKQEKAEFKIYEKLESVHSLTCSKCGMREVYERGDDLDAASWFYKQGWYATEKKLYCYNCKKP